MPDEVSSAVLRRVRPAEYDVLRAALSAEGLPTEDLFATANRFYAWEEDGQVLGFAGLERHGTAALLRSVVVPPERRRSGVGRRMVEAVLARAAALGHSEVHLLTLSAGQFFNRLGFVGIERDRLPPTLASSAQVTRLCPASAVAMVRRLRQSS